MKTSSLLTLSLFGIPHIEVVPGTVFPTYKKARSLLFLLSSQPSRQYSRDQLCELLWPDAERESARANLRRMIHHLKESLEHRDDQPVLIVRGDLLQINNRYPHSLDVHHFDELTTLTGSYDVSHLDKADSLYRGEFLEGWEEYSPIFDAWLDEQRRRWQVKACSLYIRIAEDCSRIGDIHTALRAAERAVDIDKADGHCLRSYLKLLVKSGRGIELDYVYDRHRHYLREEFDVAPEAATRSLYENLMANRDVAANQDSRDNIMSYLHSAHHALKHWDYIGAQEICRHIGNLLQQSPQSPATEVLHAEWQTLSNITDERLAAKEKAHAPTKSPLGRAMGMLPEGIFIMRFAAWAGADSKHGPVRAEIIARQLVELSSRCGPWARHRADMALILALFWQGKFVEARSIAESVELSEFLPADVLERYGGGLIEVLIPNLLSWSLLFCGEQDAANSTMEQALALARLRREPVSLSSSLATAANLARWQDKPEQTQALAEELIAMSEQGAPPVLTNQAKLLRYWALRRLGYNTESSEWDSGLNDIRRIAPAMEAVGYIILAEAACATGMAPDSRESLEHALQCADQYGQTHYHAELHRLLAEWHFYHGDKAIATRHLEDAEHFALKQGNRWAAMRISTSRRLWQGRWGEETNPNIINRFDLC